MRDGELPHGREPGSLQPAPGLGPACTGRQQRHVARPQRVQLHTLGHQEAPQVHAAVGAVRGDRVGTLGDRPGAKGEGRRAQVPILTLHTNRIPQNCDIEGRFCDSMVYSQPRSQSPLTTFFCLFFLHV